MKTPAELAADAAIEKVEAPRKKWIQRAFEEAQFYLASKPRGFEFTSDDLRFHVSPVDEPRSIGALVRRLNKAGITEPAGRWDSGSKTNHNRPMRVWRRL